MRHKRKNVQAYGRNSKKDNKTPVSSIVLHHLQFEVPIWRGMWATKGQNQFQGREQYFMQTLVSRNKSTILPSFIDLNSPEGILFFMRNTPPSNSPDVLNMSRGTTPAFHTINKDINGLS